LIKTDPPGYYDIRTDKKAFETLAAFRREAGRDAVEIADFTENFVRGEQTLKSKIPTLKIEYG
jgi:hypothetical protein